MTTLLLIRHGLSIANRDRIFIGQTDMDLTPEGHIQAACTAAFVAGKYRVDHVYASDLSRAYHTGEAVAKVFDLPVITDTRLREIFSGVWEGLPYPVLEETYKADRDIWRNDIGNCRCTGGESVREMASRVLECVTEIAQKHAGETVAVATHATPIRAMHCLLSGLEIEKMTQAPWASNASVTEVQYDAGAWRIVAAGQDKHLGDWHSAVLAKKRGI